MIDKRVSDQCFKHEDLKEVHKFEVGGGHGYLHGLLSFSREEPADDQAIREIGFMHLDPGDSMGMHKHVDNEDAYIIIKGKGLFSDGKTETVVGPGDITIAWAGQEHSLANIGDEPLEFVDVIAKK